jgi:hypothetical protein
LSNLRAPLQRRLPDFPTTPSELPTDLPGLECAGGLLAAAFRQMGLWLKDVEAAMAQGKSRGEIKAQLDSSGLRVAEFCFLGGWQDADQTRLKDVLSQTHHTRRGASKPVGPETVGEEEQLPKLAHGGTANSRISGGPGGHPH